MPAARIVLTSSTTAYNLFTLGVAQQKLFPLSARELSIQMPSATFEAANAGANVKIGDPDSVATPTDVTKPERAMIAGDPPVSYRAPNNSIPTQDKWLKGSAANVVLYVNWETT